MKKICSRCKEEKDLESFGKVTRNKTGYDNYCSCCRKEYKKEYNIKHKERIALKAKQYGQENKEYLRNLARRRSGCNKLPKDFILRSDNRPSIEQIKEEKKKWWREYYYANPEKFQEKDKNDRLKKNEKQKIRRKNDMSYRMRCNLRRRVRSIIGYGKYNRESIINLVGCELNEFIYWIESHWLEGMTWKNYGVGKNKWNLDHHYPCSLYDLTNPQQQRECFHYTNTYPMWSIENTSKGDIIPSFPRENLYIPDFAKNPNSPI